MNLNRIFRLQKRACKIILDYNVGDVMESMQDLKILTVFDRLYLNKSKFMYKVARGDVPQHNNEIFQESSIENEPQLRSTSGQTFIPPRPDKEIFKQSIAYSGPIILNSLPISLRSVDNINKHNPQFIKWTQAHRT